MVDYFIPNEHEAAALSGMETDTEEGCRENIRFFREKGVKHVLITLGELGAHIAKGAKAEGACEVFAYTGPDAKEHAAAQLCSMLQEKDALLLKASRGMRLEEIYDILKQRLNA